MALDRCYQTSQWLLFQWFLPRIFRDLGIAILYGKKTLILSIFDMSYQHYKMCIGSWLETAAIYGVFYQKIILWKITIFPYVSSLLHLTLKFMPFSYMDHDVKETLPVFQYLESLALYVL